MYSKIFYAPGHDFVSIDFNLVNKVLNWVSRFMEE